MLDRQRRRDKFPAVYGVLRYAYWPALAYFHRVQISSEKAATNHRLLRFYPVVKCRYPIIYAHICSICIPKGKVPRTNTDFLGSIYDRLRQH